jgi:hypothetical protein
MTAKLALTEYPIEMYALRSTRRTAQERLVLTLMSLGMIASLVAFVSYQQALKYQLKSDELYPLNIVKSQLFYVAHATEIILLVSAGLAALIFTNWQSIERGYLMRFALFLGATLLMTARGYSLSELLSTKLVDVSGPCPFFMSMLVFIGARRRNWDFLGVTMVIMAMLFSALTLVSIAGLRTFTRPEGVASLGLILDALYWPASWIALKDYPQHSLVRFLRFGPIVIFSLGSLFTQTRLLFVMIFALLAVYVYLQRRRKIPQAAAWIFGLILVVWMALFTNVFLKDTRVFQKVESVADAFSSRLTEDTRTGQVLSFAQSVQLHELVLGRGSQATWNWGNAAWRGGTDIGYLTLLFYGGVPLIVTYVATHLKPCLTVLRSNWTNWQLTSACVVLLWGIRLFSSGYPVAALNYYPILFCMGACISREPAQQTRRSQIRRTAHGSVSHAILPTPPEGVLQSATQSAHLEATKSD